jgi:hypothetical protein
VTTAKRALLLRLKLLVAVLFVAPAAMTAAVTNLESGAIVAGFTVVLFFMTQSF